METYLLAIISDKIKGAILSDVKFRILDLSPSAKVKVYDYRADTILRHLTDGDIEIKGISKVHYTQDNGKSKFRIRYYNDSAEKLIPVLKTEKNTSRKIQALKIRYTGPGTGQILLADVMGNLQWVNLDDLPYQNYNIYNIKFILKKSSNNYPAVRADGREFIVCNLDGKYMEIENMPKFESVNNSIINDRFFTEWIDAHEFIQECAMRNYDYDISYYVMRDIGYNEEIANVPNGVEIIGGIAPVGTNYDKVTTLRIPESVHTIMNGGILGIPNLRKIIWQDKPKADESNYNRMYLGGMSDLVVNDNFSGLRLCDILTPNIQYLAEYMQLDYRKYINIKSDLADVSVDADLNYFDSILFLDRCFKDVKLRNCEYLPDSLKKIEKSFKNVTGISRISFGESINEIQESFIDTQCLQELDFTRVKKISKIEGSFNEFNGRILDLSSIDNFTGIQKSFINCPNLEELYLPKYIGSIIDSFVVCPKLHKIVFGRVYSISGCFEVCNIQELDTPDGATIHKSFPENCKFVCNKEDYNSTIILHDNQTCVLSNKVKNIRHNSFNNCSLDKYNIPNTIESIGQSVFSYAKTDVFDMYDWKTEIIPVKCFDSSRINTLILPKCTKVINENAFAFSHITRLFIPSSVEELKYKIGDPKKVANNSKTLHIYTTKDSIASKIKSKIVVVHTFDTDDEAYNEISGNNIKSSSSKQLKGKLIMSGSSDPVMAEIAQNENIEYIEMLTNLYDTISSKENPHNKVKLDTSNYKTLYKLKDLLNIMNGYFIKKFRFTIDVEQYEKPFGNIKFRDNFKAISNVITYLTKQSEWLSSLNGLSVLMENLGANLLETSRLSKTGFCGTIYEDQYSCIIQYEIPTIGTIFEKEILTITVIAIGGNVVYITSELASTYKKYGVLRSINSFSFTKSNELLNSSIDKYNCSVYDILDIGDEIAMHKGLGDCSKGSCKIPQNLSSILRNLIEDTMCVIADNAKSIDLSSKILYSILDGSVYEVLGIGDTSNNSQFSIPTKCSRFTVKNKWKSIKDVPEKILDSIKTLGFNKSADIYMMSNFSKEYLAIMNLRQDSYDKVIQTYEYRLSKWLVQNNIKGTSDLTENAIAYVLKSKFFVPIAKPESSLKQNIIVSNIKISDDLWLTSRQNKQKRNTVSNVLSNSASIVSYFTNDKGRPLEIVGKEGKVRVYGSYTTVGTILNTIRKIYSSEFVPVGGVSDTVYNMYDTFVIVDRFYFGWGNRALQIGISRYYGEYFLIATDHSEGSQKIKAIPLFRFKDGDCAVKASCLLHCAGMDESITPKDFLMDKSIRTLLKWTADAAFDGHKAINGNENNVYRLRQDIMNGEPNGLLKYPNIEKFDRLCARQEK